MSGLKPGPISEARARARAKTNTGILRCAQDDGEKRAKAEATARATTGVLRCAQDDEGWGWIIVTEVCDLEEFAVGEVADEGEVGGEEVVVGEGGEGGPEHVLEDAVDGLSLEVADEEEFDFDGSAVAVGVADGGDARSDGGVDGQLFVQFAGEGLFGGFVGLDLASGELPLEAHGLAGATLTDEDFAGGAFAAQNQRGYDASQRLGSLG